MLKKNKFYQSLYENRALKEGYPDLKRLGAQYKAEKRQKIVTPDGSKRYQQLFDFFFQLVNREELSGRSLDVGCGPTPVIVQEMLLNGFDARGIEPVLEMCQSAREFLKNNDIILNGNVEQIPVPDSSQSFVVLNYVLEHVDSPIKTMNEIYRVLEPGGVAYISTTNRHLYYNGEYTKRFFQWYPSILKESYVFMHLHYLPELARYSSRPAVHWFSYSDLCKLGRDAGFSSFYSTIDLINEKTVKKRYKSVFLSLVKYSPLLRSVFLTFTSRGSIIFMVKRRAE